MPAIRGPDSKRKARRHTAPRALDLIAADLSSPAHLQHHMNALTGSTRKSADGTPAYDGRADLPSGGEHYCTECAKFFDSETNLAQHRRGKVHKRRVRDLTLDADGVARGVPPSQREVEEAAGLGVDNGVVSRRKEGTEAARPAVVAMDVDGGGGVAGGQNGVVEAGA